MAPTDPRVHDRPVGRSKRSEQREVSSEKREACVNGGVFEGEDLTRAPRGAQQIECQETALA